MSTSPGCGGSEPARSCTQRRSHRRCRTGSSLLKQRDGAVRFPDGGAEGAPSASRCTQVTGIGVCPITRGQPSTSRSRTQACDGRRRAGGSQGQPRGATKTTLRNRACFIVGLPFGPWSLSGRWSPPDDLESAEDHTSCPRRARSDAAGELRAGADAELRVDLRQVRLDRPDADEQLRGDLLVRAALGDELGDLAAPSRSGPRSSIGRRSGHAPPRRAPPSGGHRAARTPPRRPSASRARRGVAWRGAGPRRARAAIGRARTEARAP